MKTAKLSIFAMTLLSLVMFSGGCSTTSQIKTAQSILSVQSGVHNLMTNYGIAVEAGAISLEDRVKVREAYRKYEAVENSVVAGLEMSDLSIQSSPEVLSNAAFEITILILNLLN